MSTQSGSRFLIATPPYCPTVECYEHGDGVEHHVEGCPVAETVAGSMHRFVHATNDVAATLMAATRAANDEGESLWRLTLALAGSRRRRTWLRFRRWISR